MAIVASGSSFGNADQEVFYAEMLSCEDPKIDVTAAHTGPLGAGGYAGSGPAMGAAAEADQVQGKCGPMMGVWSSTQGSLSTT